MRLFEAIMDANQRALAGDGRAGLHPDDFPDALPIVALTCADPRLNHLLPEVLGVREQDFIWLRNAGNVVTDSLSSIVRNLALACVVKGGKEIAVIGHTDCRVRQVSVSQLLEGFRLLGVDRSSLPDNLPEFFGLFASERQNVLNAASHLRDSPWISAKVPVHGLIVDTDSGRLEWLVNGYEHLRQAHANPPPLLRKLEQVKERFDNLAQFNLGELKFPDVKIGDLVLNPSQWSSEWETAKANIERAVSRPKPPEPPPPAGVPPPEVRIESIPIPPPIATIKNFLRIKK